jgi:hypothetical protein
MKNGVFWDVTPCVMMEALSSFETSLLTRGTRRNIPEEGIIHIFRRENLKSYTGTATHQKFRRWCLKNGLAKHNMPFSKINHFPLTCHRLNFSCFRD